MAVAGRMGRKGGTGPGAQPRGFCLQAINGEGLGPGRGKVLERDG